MNELTNRFAGGLARSLIFLAGSVLLAPSSASAHEVTYVYSVNHGYDAHNRSVWHFPRWLRARQDFQHWYFRSHYRYMRRISWQRLYDLYLYEKRRARHHSRHYDHHDYRNHRNHDGHRDGNGHRNHESIVHARGCSRNSFSVRCD